VRRVLKSLGAGVAVAALLSGTAGASVSAKTISNGKYAKMLCGQLNGVLDKIKQVSTPNTSDPAQYQQQTLAIVDALIAELKAAQAKLKKVSPSDGGKKVTKLFDKYLVSYETQFKQARDTFAAADPASPAFTGAVTILSAALSTSDVKAGDPFGKLSGQQDLLSALKGEKSCKQIVTVV
jgi:hypothetical protein